MSTSSRFNADSHLVDELHDGVTIYLMILKSAEDKKPRPGTGFLVSLQPA
jgi:hypothetical protein